MTPDTWDRLAPFRDEALARDIPAEDVERWIATARPCATLSRDGDGPVVGRFGGPLLLPADAPEPENPFVATIHLAALPAGTDLPLPPDGDLLLFAFPEIDYETLGGVVHVPAGTEVTERDKLGWDSFDWEENEAMMEEFPEGPLHATIDVSLPCHAFLPLPDVGTLPGHPRAEELVAVWESTRAAIASSGTLQIGGYADEETVGADPVVVAVPDAVKALQAAGVEGPVSEDAADWVLLADWQAGWDVEGWESATVHWIIQREDLAARRFDRAYTSIFWNP